MARTLHWMLALSVAAAWLTGGSRPGGLHHVTAGALAGALLAVTVARIARSGRAGPTAKARISAVFGVVLVVVVVSTGAVVLGGEEQWAPALVGVGTGVRVHDVHRLASWLLVGWIGVHAAGALLHWWRRAPPARTEAGAAAVALAITAPVVLGAPETPAGTRADADPTWTSECGDCHLAYPPELLPARSWSRMIDGSDDHFGEDLALAPETRAALRDWMAPRAAEADANEHAWRIHRSVPADEAPLRITALDWWTQAHAAVPDAAFDDPDVRSRGRCQACHPDAASGAFQADPHLTPEKTP